MYLPISISFPTFLLPWLSLSPFTGSRKKHLLCFLSSHLILPELPLWEGSCPSGTFVLGTDEYDRALQRVLCFWDASQVLPPAPSPSSLSLNSSCSDANVVTHFFQPDGWKMDGSDAWSFQICSLIRPPGVYSRLITQCAYAELAGGRREHAGSGAYAVHPASLQACFNSWSFLKASSPCRTGESLGCLGGPKRCNRVWQDLHHKLSAECSRLTLQFCGAFG